MRKGFRGAVIAMLTPLDSIHKLNSKKRLSQCNKEYHRKAMLDNRLQPRHENYEKHHKNEQD